MFSILKRPNLSSDDQKVKKKNKKASDTAEFPTRNRETVVFLRKLFPRMRSFRDNWT